MACYNCDSPATTREHVPPRGFFPRGFWNNLWIVLSGITDNLDNSLHVEYARNVIVSHRNAAGTAQQLAQSVSFRSFEHSSALFFQTFQNVEFAVVNGVMHRDLSIRHCPLQDCDGSYRLRSVLSGE